jgi:hypothetical protein
MAADVKVVAIGDSGQLSSVRAGGWLGALTRRLGSHELREVMRQRDPRERRLLAHVHGGDPAAYVKLKADRGELRVFSGKAPSIDAEEAVIEAWAAASERYGIDQAVIVCRDNQRRLRLNELARAHLRERGRLGESVEIGRRQWALGDRVIARRNDRGRDVDNGMRGTITSIDQERDRLIVQVDSGGPRELDSHYVERHAQHAYALTGHGMQGGTVEWAAVIGQPGDFSRNWSYTALSRAREPVQIFLVAEPTRLEEEREEVAPAHRSDPPADPVALMTRRMRERDDEDLALEQLDRGQRDDHALLSRNADVAPPDLRHQLVPESDPAARPQRSISPVLIRLAQLEEELTQLYLQLTDHHVEDARTIIRLNDTIVAVEAEQQRDRKPRGLRNRAPHATRSRERERHLEHLRGQRAQLLDRTPEPDAVLARAERLRQDQHRLSAERRRLRAQAINVEIESEPPWLTATLGHEPQDGHRERWWKTAREIAGHRIDRHITHPNIALDEHDHDHALRRAITETRAMLGLDPTAADREIGHER